jgi:DNA-binding NtrC family response regulator
VIALKTVLIIDSDLGFVFWLARILEESGYDVLPAKSFSDGISLARRFERELAVLIVNPSFPGSSAFIDYLHRVQDPKLIALTESLGSPVPYWVSAMRTKPLKFDESAGQEWLRLVKSVFIADDQRSASP